MILEKIVQVTVDGHDTRLCDTNCKFLIWESNDHLDLKEFRCHLGKEILTHAKINGIDRPFRGKMCVMSVVVTKWGMIDDERATALLLGAEIDPTTQETNNDR